MPALFSWATLFTGTTVAEITAPAAAAVTLLYAAWIAAWECRASVRIRSCARGLTSCISSFRKQSRAGNQIGRVFLQRCFGKTGAQNAELNWNGDLFFHGDADADDQVGGNFSVRTDAEISAGVVGRQAACEAGIAKLCQTRAGRRTRLCSAYRVQRNW